MSITDTGDVSMRMALFLAAFLPSPAAATPLQFTHQGHLSDVSGVAINGPHTVTFELFATDTSTAALWSETDSLVLDHGYYSTILGDGTPLGAVLDGSSRYLQITVDSQVLSPREVVLSVPYAVRAFESERVVTDAVSVCDADHVGLLRWTGAELKFCSDGVADYSVILGGVPDGVTALRANVSCKQLLADLPQLLGQDSWYWIDPDGLGVVAPFQAYCDMSTDGGGWTQVMTVAPADGNSVGFNNQAFWTTDAPYGTDAAHFANDYKAPAAYLLRATQLMIQSTAPGATGGVLGWRRWPMTYARTFDSFFATGIPAVHATDACETLAADAGVAGTSSASDDILRQGSCLYADVNPSSNGQGDTIRLTTISGNSTDNQMSGFASCIDCGSTWQTAAGQYMGMDRAACGAANCSYASICRMPGADCVGSYCSSTYSQTSCGAVWNSRFYVR